MIMMLWFSLLHIWRKICSKFGEEFVVGVSDFDVELLYFGGKIVVFGEKINIFWELKACIIDYSEYLLS